MDKTYKIENCTIADKIHSIHDIYQSFYMDEQYLLKKLRKNADMSKHFLFDATDTILNTFEVFNHCKEIIGKKCTKEEHILNNIGLMQLIYVHQDLIDEILSVFKIQNNSLSMKRKKNRDIRNELIGHPISRTVKGRELQTTSVWCWDDKMGEIKYLRREEGSMLKQDTIKYPILKVIDDHLIYMNICCDLILRRQLKHLKGYDVKLKSLRSLILLRDVSKIIEMSVSPEKGILQRTNLSCGYYSQKNLEAAYNKIENSPRYKFFIDSFLNEILDNWEEYIPLSQIEEIKLLLDNKKRILDYKDERQIEIIFEDGKPHDKSEAGQDIKKEKVQVTLAKEYSYYLQKIHEKRYISDIDLLIRNLKDYNKIVKELEHMKKHWTTKENDYEKNMEFYSSYLYFEDLMSKSTIEKEIVVTK